RGRHPGGSPRDERERCRLTVHSSPFRSGIAPHHPRHSDEEEEAMQGLTRFVFGVALAGLVVGCGESSGNNDGGGAGGAGGFGVDLPTAESYYPQKVGNSWTYVVTPSDIDLHTYKTV